MTDRNLSYVAIDAGNGHYGLVTDAILRRRLLAEGGKSHKVSYGVIRRTDED